MRKLYAVLATVATLLAMAVASSACMFFTYQPRNPNP
jgi:cyclic lactone autoinducer peptide